MMKISPLALALALTAAAPAPADADDEAGTSYPASIEGTCRTIDGDTVDIEIAGGQAHRVRLFAILAAEYDTVLGAKASAVMDRLCHRRTVACRIRNRQKGRRGRAGRLIGICRNEAGTWLAGAMLRSGFAWLSRYYARREPDTERRLERDQAAAIEAGRGIWSMPPALRLE